MNHWPFILTAYGLSFIATVALLWASLRSMRRAEAEAEALKGER